MGREQKAGHTGLQSAADPMTEMAARREGPRCSHDSSSTSGEGAVIEGGWHEVKKKHRGIMGACVLCDKLAVVCTLADSRKSKETGHLTPPTFTKVRRDSVARACTSEFISVKLGRWPSLEFR